MKTTFRSKRLALIYSAVLLCAVFAAGALAGFYAGRRTGPARPAPPPGAGLGPPEMRQLNLTLEQEIKAREIGERYRPELEKLRQQIRPEADKIHRKMRAELRKILTPAQRQLHDRLERNSAMGPPGGPDGLGGPGGPEGPGGLGGPGGPGGPGGQGGPGGDMTPPPEARRACDGKPAESPCTFTLPSGESVTGVCRRPPHESDPVCIPNSHLR